MRRYLDAAYALLTVDADVERLDELLDAPFEREMTDDERRARDRRRDAEENRVAQEAALRLLGMAG